MRDIFNSYLPKFLVELKRKNEDIAVVTTKYIGSGNELYELDTRVIAPIVVSTTRSLQELQPEISTAYPFKIVTPLDYDGATILQSPSVDTQPTASQGYYAPIYFERYNKEVLKEIDTEFKEL